MGIMVFNFFLFKLGSHKKYQHKLFVLYRNIETAQAVFLKIISGDLKSKCNPFVFNIFSRSGR